MLFSISQTITISIKGDTKYNLWYRTTGEASIESIDTWSSTTEKTVGEVLRDVGDHHITHLLVKFSTLPPLEELCPHIEFLSIVNAAPSDDLSV